jgi:hypothetical protein
MKTIVRGERLKKLTVGNLKKQLAYFPDDLEVWCCSKRENDGDIHTALFNHVDLLLGELHT